MGFKVKLGDRVIKNQKAYSIKVGEKVNEPPMQDEGTITKLEPLKVGDELRKGQPADEPMTEYMFDPNTDPTTLRGCTWQGWYKI
ncbi:MAG: hypothetical protein U5K54_27485 [Cytophagales bacterium]|nr:hypothetical protein [Cytophagales bacterium]